MPNNELLDTLQSLIVAEEKSALALLNAVRPPILSSSTNTRTSKTQSSDRSRSLVVTADLEHKLLSVVLNPVPHQLNSSKTHLHIPHNCWYLQNTSAGHPKTIWIDPTQSITLGHPQTLRLGPLHTMDNTDNLTCLTTSFTSPFSHSLSSFPSHNSLPQYVRPATCCPALCGAAVPGHRIAAASNLPDLT